MQHQSSLSHHIATGIAEKHPRPKHTVPKPAAVLACSYLLAVELGDLGEVMIRVTLRLIRVALPSLHLA